MALSTDRRTLLKRRFRVLFYTICATIVACAGWVVLLFGGLLHLIYGAQGFPRVVFWIVLAISLPLFVIHFYRYFNRVER
jgi:hypothetical protein